MVYLEIIFCLFVEYVIDSWLMEIYAKKLHLLVEIIKWLWGKCIIWAYLHQFPSLGCWFVTLEREREREREVRNANETVSRRITVSWSRRVVLFFKVFVVVVVVVVNFLLFLVTVSLRSFLIISGIVTCEHSAAVRSLSVGCWLAAAFLLRFL